MTVNNYEGNVTKKTIGSKGKMIVVGVSLAAITVCGFVMNKTLRRDINQLWSSVTQKDSSQDNLLNLNAANIKGNKDGLYVLVSQVKANTRYMYENTSDISLNTNAINIIQHDISYLHTLNDSLLISNESLW